MASWKVQPDAGLKIEYTSFRKAQKFFAVDDSGSTAGSILRQEREFVSALRRHHANEKDCISLWGTKCDDPTRTFKAVKWHSSHAMTCPNEILRNSASLAAIQQSEVWFLVTDGAIHNAEVHQLAELAHERDILSVPIVFLIVGSRGRTPDTTNISVGISFFAGAQDTLILFKEKETGTIYLIAGKGCFAPLGGSTAAQDLTSWRNVPTFDSESTFMKHCAELDILIPTVVSRMNGPRGVSLGPQWEIVHGGQCLVDLELLLQRGTLSDDDLLNLFAEEAFNILAIAYKTRRRIPEFRTFVQAQKVEQFAPKLEDVSGAATIIAKMNEHATSDENRKCLQEQLRKAHSKNRDHYRKIVAEFEGSEKEQNIRKRNSIVDAAMRHLATVEASGFNADILSRRSNRARRAEQVSADTNIAVTNLDLEGEAYRGFCLVCCGEEEVMSICLKELDPEHADDNTSDFALNFPLAAGSSAKNVNMLSSQNICFQCALSGPSGLSIYKEKLKAVIPLVKYDTTNKKYINDQLYLALTTGLATGAAGIAQLFMAILHRVLETKAWAGSELANSESQVSATQHQDILQRRQTFRWMLDQLLDYTRTRENFVETGAWVNYARALVWVGTDFEANNMASFVVTYPASGFSTLMALIKKKLNGIDAELLEHMRIAKVVYSITAKYLANLQVANQNQSAGDAWKQKYLELLYQEFNSELVPRDLHGTQSIVTSADEFFNRLCARFGHPLLGKATTQIKTSMMRKIQLIIFWLLNGQKSHCTAQTFFTKIEHNEDLASAVLKPALHVPESGLHSTLLSVFAIHDASELIDAEAAEMHHGVVPYKSPFGASVLCCGIEACGEPFFSGGAEEAVQHLEAIRKNRAQHLIRVFGIRNRFEGSNGLPEPIESGKSPSSIHANVHIGIAREWAETTRAKRRVILENDEEREAFVTSVCKRVCKQGRGDVHSKELQTDIRNLLPSFFAILGQALRMEGKSDEDITVYEHDFDQNKTEARIRWELRALQVAG